MTFGPMGTGLPFPILTSEYKKLKIRADEDRRMREIDKRVKHDRRMNRFILAFLFFPLAGLIYHIGRDPVAAFPIISEFFYLAARVLPIGLAIGASLFLIATFGARTISYLWRRCVRCEKIKYWEFFFRTEQKEIEKMDRYREWKKGQ